jgi:hypothetical protein
MVRVGHALVVSGYRQEIVLIERGRVVLVGPEPYFATMQLAFGVC